MNYAHITPELDVVFDFWDPEDSWCRKIVRMEALEPSAAENLRYRIFHVRPAVDEHYDTGAVIVADDATYGSDVLAMDLVYISVDGVDVDPTEEPTRCYRCSRTFGDLSGCSGVEPAPWPMDPSPWPVELDHQEFTTCAPPTF